MIRRREASARTPYAYFLCGVKALAITGDKSTIEIGTLDKLPKIIETIIEAVKAGELDKQLNAAMAERRLKLKKVS